MSIKWSVHLLQLRESNATDKTVTSLSNSTLPYYHTLWSPIMATTALSNKRHARMHALTFPTATARLLPEYKHLFESSAAAMSLNSTVCVRHNKSRFVRRKKNRVGLCRFSTAGVVWMSVSLSTTSFSDKTRPTLVKNSYQENNGWHWSPAT